MLEVYLVQTIDLTPLIKFPTHALIFHTFLPPLLSFITLDKYSEDWKEYKIFSKVFHRDGHVRICIDIKAIKTFRPTCRAFNII